MLAEQMRAEKVRQLVLNGFSRGALKQWIHRWPQGCRYCLRGCLGESYSTGIAYSAITDLEGPPDAVSNPVPLPMDSREGLTGFLEAKDSHLLDGVLNICSHIFR